MTWPADAEALKPGDKCMYRYPARNLWRPATVVHNGGSGFWRVHNAEAGEVGGLYIEFIRVVGDPEAHPEAPARDRVEPCPSCESGEVIVDPETHDGVCPDCDALVDFGPE